MGSKKVCLIKSDDSKFKIETNVTDKFPPQTVTITSSDGGSKATIDLKDLASLLDEKTATKVRYMIHHLCNSNKRKEL
ncbi:MAG: hypothetical protein PHT54_02670 [Candidatus Nanoarchaeia archaeon]|nr:hypothetical protein [Candidatus Nanoarchaeia archaeon]